MHRFGRISAILLVLGLALGACGADDGDQQAGGGNGGDGGDGGPSATTPTTADEPDEPAGVAKVDWLSPALTVDLGGGFTLRHCEGMAPIHCLAKDGEPAGLVELASYPLTSVDAISKARARGDRAALEAHVEDFLTSFRGDRRQGCGPDYVVTPEPLRFVDAPDGLMANYGFQGAPKAGAAPTERTLQWAGFRGSNLVLLSISAYDPTSCVESGSEGTVAELAEVEPRLRPLVEGNALPVEVGPAPGL
jgi:hypothetical protein